MEGFGGSHQTKNNECERRKAVETPQFRDDFISKSRAKRDTLENKKRATKISHLKHRFHFARQKRDNDSAVQMLHQMCIWVVVVALGLVPHISGNSSNVS